MDNKEYLFEAIGEIDDDLVDDAAVMKPKQKIWPIVAAVACAAVLLLAILSGKNGQSDPAAPDQMSSSSSQPDPDVPIQLLTAENIWLKNDFAAFSVSYAPMQGQNLFSVSGNYAIHLLNTRENHQPSGTPVLETTPLVISETKTLQLQALIGRRYIAYISEKGYPVFYDTQTDSLVDLQERMLGDTNEIFLELMKSIELRAQKDYPGFLNSETNRRILWEYVYYRSRGLSVDDVQKQCPDTGFIPYLDGYTHKDEEDCLDIFWKFCLDLYRETDKSLRKKPYGIHVLGIDPIGGSCIVQVSDVYCSELYYMQYDIVTDTCTKISDVSGMRKIFNTTGYEFSYSPDGSVAAAIFPKVNGYTHDPLKDYIKRYEYPSYGLLIHGYDGEEIRLYLLDDNNRAITVSGPLASSKVYYAEDGSVIYYRIMPEESEGRTGYFADAVWYNRLNIVTNENDQWAFYPLKDLGQADQISDPIILQGNVVRLAANNTVAVMERGGKYYAYSLEDGRDVTQDICEDRVSMYLHEQYICWLGDGVLYRKNIFKDSEPESLGAADVFHMSDDGAFAFVYCSEDTFVTCINVVTLESCILNIDQQLANQFLAAENAKIRINYTDIDNTLLLSFYVEEEIRQALDLYSMLEQLPPNKNIDFVPEDPVVITDLQAPDWVVESYRVAAERYEHASVGEQFSYSYYPEFAPRYTDGEDLFACLGLERPEPFTHLQGTRYVLFDNGMESLILEYYIGWGLFDYSHDLAGARVLYNNGMKEYSFLYAPSFSAPTENPTIPDIDLPVDIPVEMPEPEEPYEQVILPQIHKAVNHYSGSADSYGSAVFTDEALQALVPEISEWEANEIRAYMEEILNRKDYSPHAKQQIRDTVTQLIWYYPNYQTLFAFLDPLDTKAFICNIFLDKLDAHVEHICFPCEHGRSSADYESGTVHLVLTNIAEDNAVNLIYLVTNMPRHDSWRAGMANLYTMTMIGAPGYNDLEAYTHGGYKPWQDPNADNRYLLFASGSRFGNETNNKAYFRLYALTDTATMLEYERTGNAEVIMNYLKEHYGDEGLLFYGKARYVRFQDSLESEQVFLKLFLQRLNEVETQEEMLEYLQLYRLYRKLFCVIYQQKEIEVLPTGNQSNVLELPHPELDYRSADALVAQAAYQSGMFEAGTLTESQAIELIMLLVGRREYADYDDYRHNFVYFTYDVLVIGDLRYKVYVFPNETSYRVTNYTYGYRYTISKDD